MGQTTKSGRTRNRRKIQPQSPPTGWPNMLAFLITGRPSATTVTGTLRQANGQYYPYDNFVGTGVLQVWSDPLGAVMEATATYNSGTEVWTLTTTETWEIDELYVILPWQETLRGMNGEWLSTAAFSVPT